MQQFLKNLHKRGYILVPTEKGKTPRAANGYQDKRDMNVLSKLQYAHGVGVICGRNDLYEEFLYCIDFDEYKGSITAYKDYKSLVPQELISQKTYVETTQSGGYHLWFKSTRKMPSQKIAKVQGEKKIVEIIELRGDGNYCIIDPTEGYVKIEGVDLDQLPMLTDQEVDDLLTAAKSFDEIEKKKILNNDFRQDKKKRFYDSIVDANPDNKETPWMHYNRVTDSDKVLDLLLNHGWKLNKDLPNLYRLARPEISDKWVSAVLFKENPIFYSHSSSTEFEERVGYPPSGVLCTLEYNGDYSAMAKDLYAKNYGARLKPSTATVVFSDGIEITDYEKTDEEFFVDNDIYNEAKRLYELKRAEAELRPESYQDVYVERTPCLPDSFYGELPSMLTETVANIKTSRKRDFCLLSVLSAFSGVFAQNYECHYGDDLMPFVNAFIIAGTGQGKGTAERVVSNTFAPIAKAIEAIQKTRLQDWEDQKAEAKAANRAFPDPRPLSFTATLGGSITKAGLMANCREQKGFNIFVSEADEISNSDSGQHGSFSSFIRSAYHEGRVKHKLKNEEINAQALFSLTVTGTHDQMFPFFGKNGSKNGLSNRFAFYALPRPKSYKFNTPKRGDGNTLDLNLLKEIGEKYKKMYMLFNPFNSKVDTVAKKLGFVYDDQCIELNDKFWMKRFNEAKKDNPRLSEDIITGIINRLSLMHCRMCCAIKFIELYDNDEKEIIAKHREDVRENQICKKLIEVKVDTWSTVSELMSRIFYYSLQAHLWLEDDVEESKPLRGNKRTNMAQTESLVYQNLPNEEKTFTTSEAYEIISKNEVISVSKTSVYGYIKKWALKGQLKVVKKVGNTKYYAKA